MKVTVCEFHDSIGELKDDWDELVNHVKKNGSEYVLLPEMPFFPWPAWTDEVDENVWSEAVHSHAAWLERFEELGNVIVMGSRPVMDNEIPYNEGYLWHWEEGYEAVHKKYYLPDEPGFWEASWYRRGQKEFEVSQTEGTKIGFLICTEIWYTEHARGYARNGIHILACPRATELSTADKWIAGGRAAAVMSGAYCLSSNRVGENNGVTWGGHGWIIDPNGEVLGITSKEESYVTREIDLANAEKAKSTYPRYVLE